MLPTQPSNHWWGHHHVDYQHRFGWPAPPAEAGAAAGAVEGAAAAAGAGAGGVPPRGPWGYHHYYDGYGRYGRRWGRRPGGRLVFLLIGIGGTAWYFKSKEYRREYERRMIEGSSPSSSPSHNAGPGGWGGHCRWSQQRYQSPPPPPVDHTTYTNTAIEQPTIPTSFPSQSQETEEVSNRPAWGWKNWKERKAAREEAWKAAREKYFQRLEGGPQSPQAVQSVPSEKAKAQDSEVSYPVNQQWQGGEELGDMKRLREIVEKLWEERKGEKIGQESANDKAKEYAREKLDKLSAALDTLRESLKKDAESKTKEADRKWV
ncbi:hypothetical protein I302_103294 [Kwoniella bestiolae CBS 10118]|uniref:Uncharacterized protein n=1 Tax=Kwoniella bestiolae CBS 10118 TaxID=1296100 RepID=A0A1B9G810_9TREE|nr:hypothetical protein I302_01993 [Kwoniella bestiolae CBS 10118]OCF27158.1 hypothetical protein I302_01993 [Kwoniella bestiolae CBS 10118]